MALLAVGHESGDDAVIVRAKGEVDTSSVEELAAHLTAALRLAHTHPSQLVVVDLRELTFFGSAGLNAIVTCHLSGADEGTAVRLVADHAPVLQPLQVTEVDRILDIYPTLSAALRG